MEQRASAIANTTAADLPLAIRWLIVISAAAGGLEIAIALANWDSPDLFKYIGFLVVALAAGSVHLALPGLRSPLSFTFAFVLIGLVEFTPSETVLLGCLPTVAECYWRNRTKPELPVVIFRTALMAAAIAVGQRVFDSEWLVAFGFDTVFRLAAAGIALFLLNSVPIAVLDSALIGEAFATMWKSDYMWLLPYYLGGAVLAKIVVWADHFAGWQTVLLTGPVVYLIYRSYSLYLERLEDERRHAQEVSSLHLRTIEALALAIDAKDQTTHDHLQRVQVYALAIGRELGLSADELEALRAASLLHDIGKLAVPEHIISKPGRLTPEEFDKMKIHPIVGAEILERVQFPYPVVPIVRAHHEKWDGTGYPYGLAGEEIPIGARILSAVDCLDALATDRQYRRAIPLADAMKVVQLESGKAFDPKVVELLSRHFVELEQKAQSKRPRVSRNVENAVTVKGAAPAAGFETAAAGSGATGDFLSSIAAARQEVQAIFEISQDLGNSLSLDETLSVLGVRLRRIIPHHSLAIWLRRNNVLEPEYVNGEDYRLFSSLSIPIGQGLSGWVAENGKPVLNGNPSVEPGYLNDRTKFSTLRSAVAVPLEAEGGITGVLTLYHLDKDAFTKDHLRVLLGISPKIGMSIENALRFRQVESSATIDFLTELPNARSLFLQLDSELARSKRERGALAVLVLDLDGFKQVNDKFGHMAGNKLLHKIAVTLKSCCREYDYVARLGGDEFVVLLPGARREDAETRAAELRSLVAQIGSEQTCAGMITTSIGVAQFPEDGSSAEDLLAEADRRMYLEKRNRKNSRAVELRFPLDRLPLSNTVQ
jgi:diguanylate cyclase (GGDEF)-like protein/putative nucleotidyltransferase with HDIG domain